MGAGMYRVRVIGELDSTRIRAELARLSKTPLVFGGGKAGKGGAFATLGTDAKRASKNIKGLNGQVVQTDKKLKGVRTNSGVYGTIGKDAKQSAGHMKTFGAETLNVTKKVIQFGAVTAIIRGVTSGLGDMVQNVFELDAALTEFKKVSDLTGKSLDKYTAQAYKAGRETARTGTEMIEAATQFRKMGYSDQQSMQLATTATMFQNIADAEISAGDAALFINSQLKAFNFTADDSMHVIDSVNEVANNFAVGTNDLQLALSKTASAMGGFGNSFEQTIGIITAGTEIMVGQPSKVARGWRTIGANITKLAKQTDVYRDASGKVEIQMRKSDGTMKNTYEFLTDLHKQWGNLNKEQQTAIALEMGGKNQMEVFMATMNNFDTAIRATNTAMEAQGSAARENGRYLESLQGHLANLKSAWEEFSYKMVSSDLLKKGIDVLASALHFLSSDIGQLLIKGALLATTFNLIAKAALGFKGLSLISLVKNLTGVGKGAKEATDALKIMQGAQVGAAKGTSALYGVFGKLTGSLLGSAGLVAGIGLLSVALAKYVPIGERAADIKITKQLKEAQSDLEKTEKKYQSLTEELEKLQEREKEGTLTDSEANRLAILENQTEQYKRQLELKREIAGNKAEEYYKTVDPSKLTGRSKEKYLTAKSAGKSDKEALAAAGINDKIALSLDNVKNHTDELTKAQEELQKAYEHNGKDSKQYKKALENLNKVQDKQKNKAGEQIDGLTKLENVRKNAIKQFGSEEEAAKKLGESWKELNKEINALQALETLNFEKPIQNMQSLKDNAHTLGIEFGKSGKSIRNLDLDTFNQKMVEAGYTTEQTWEYLKALGKENPRMKIDIDGTKVALKDLEFVDGKIKKIDKAKANPIVKVATDQATKATETITKAIKGVTGKNVTVKANTSGYQALQNLKNAISNIKNKTVSIVAKIFKRNEAHGVRHFAAGGGIPNAEVNEQGFEIIQDSATGLMRVVNGGKRGLTTLAQGDSVYTHGQSVRMLHNAGLTENQVVHGHQNEDFGLFGVSKLRGFKSGTKATSLTQSQYNTKFNAITEAYDSALSSLEYQREREHWLDSTYEKYYKQLYDKYTKQIKNLNKSSVKKGVKKNTTLGTDRVREYNLAMSQISHDAAIGKISSYIEGHRMTGSEQLNVLRTIDAARKEKKISYEEAEQYRKEAYKKNLEYNIKQYQNNKNTYKYTLDLLKKYYNWGKITADEYYKYLEDLAKDQLEKEKNRLTEQQNKLTDTYDLAKAYVQRQIDLLQTENEEQQEQNQLIELQNNLAKARNQRIKIYKEGEGFVYEKDTEAIREATQALQEYQDSTKSTTNPVLAQWQEVLKLFDDIEADNALRQLEIAVGSNVNTLFGKLGTDTSLWSDWIKNNLAKSSGLQNVVDAMDKLVDTNDILNYLDSSGKVKQSVIDSAVANSKLPTTYASQITQAAQASALATGVISSLGAQKAMATMANGAVVSGSATTYGNIYNFDNLVLPNVTNGVEFIDALNNLDTTALQVSAQRT